VGRGIWGSGRVDGRIDLVLWGQWVRWLRCGHKGVGDKAQRPLYAMRIIAYIGVAKDGLSLEGFEKLFEIYPAGRSPGGFSCGIPAESQEARSIMALLEAQGVAGRYRRQLHRIYEDDDLAGAAYLGVFPTTKVEMPRQFRDAKGRAIVEGVMSVEDDPPDFTIGFGKPGDFVAESLKRAIEDQGFIGPVFSEAIVVPGYGRIPSEPLWEMGSHVVLPKLSNTHELIHALKKPFTGDYSRPVFVREPPFARRSAEFHYRQSDLRALEPFDLARTFEFYHTERHALVASQRCYQFCHKRRLPINWQPVRIDPGWEKALGSNLVIRQMSEERLLSYPWSSFGAYLAAPEQRPSWIRVDRGSGRGQNKLFTQTHCPCPFRFDLADLA
jgi:hypothetical protein